MFVYVAGPYTHGDTAANVRIAIQVADKLLSMGHFPFVPHLTHFWHFYNHREYEEWLRYDMEWLKQCDAVYRIEGLSSGADRECAKARELGKPIYRRLADVPIGVER